MTLLLNCAHKISHALRHKIEAVIGKESGLDSSAGFRDSPKEAEHNWSSPWRHRHWQQPYLGTHSTMRTLMLANMILQSSSLSVSGTYVVNSVHVQDPESPEPHSQSP